MTKEGIPAYPEFDYYGQDKKTFEGGTGHTSTGGEDKDWSPAQEKMWEKAEKKEVKEKKKAEKIKLKKEKKAARKAKYDKKQIDYLQKQKLNSLISKLNRRGYTDFKKGETTFEDIQEWLGTLSPGHPAMQPGGDASLVERWQEFKDTFVVHVGQNFQYSLPRIRFQVVCLQQQVQTKLVH